MRDEIWGQKKHQEMTYEDIPYGEVSYRDISLRYKKYRDIR